MAPVLAVVAGQIMRFVFLVSAKSHMTRYIQKGTSPSLAGWGGPELIPSDRYVEMLEQQQQQLVNGLQELYDIVISNRGWKGSLLNDSTNGRPLTHDLLERVGALKLDSNVEAERFEEDLDLLRQKVALDEGGSPPNVSTDSGFQSQTAFPECSSPRHVSNDLFPIFTSFPPTPPLQNSAEQASVNLVHSSDRVNPALSLDPSKLHSSRQSWAPPQPSTYDENLDFIRFEMPPDFTGLHSMQESANHSLPLSPWMDDYLDPLEMSTGMTWIRRTKMFYGTYERSVQTVETRGAMLGRSFHWRFVVMTTYSRTFWGGSFFWYHIFSDPVGFECFSRHGFSRVGSVDGTVPQLSTGPLCLYLQLHQIPHLYHVFPFISPKLINSQRERCTVREWEWEWNCRWLIGDPRSRGRCLCGLPS